MQNFTEEKSTQKLKMLQVWTTIGTILIGSKFVVVNSYICGDGCEIEDNLQSDGYCDCCDCSDEINYDCYSCQCPSTCGEYYQCTGGNGTGSGPQCDATSGNGVWTSDSPSDTTLCDCSTCDYDYCLCGNGSDDSFITGDFWCWNAGCGVSKTFYIYGKCDYIELTVQIREMGFAQNDQYAEIYINHDFISQCEGLNDDCTLDWYVFYNVYWAYIYICLVAIAQQIA